MLLLTHPALALSQILDEGQSPKHSQCQSRAVQEWSVQQVSHWLMSLNLEQYVSEFSAHNVNGEHLLQLDGSKLKVTGWTSGITNLCCHLGKTLASSSDSLSVGWCWTRIANRAESHSSTLGFHAHLGSEAVKRS